MTDRLPIGTVIEQDGFRGAIIGFVSGLMVIEGRLEGTMPAHTSCSDELAFVIQGEVIVTVEGERSTLTAGQSIVVPAGKSHEVATARYASLLLVG